MDGNKYPYHSLSEEDKIKWLEKYRHIFCEPEKDVVNKQFLRAESFKAIIDYATAYVGISKNCVPKTHVTITHIKSIYYADRALRNILLAAIDVIETHLKTVCVEILCKEGEGDPFFYIKCKDAFFKGNHPDAIKNACDFAAKSDEPYIVWFKQYNEFPNLPFWALIGLFTIGDLIDFCYSLRDIYMNRISNVYGKKPKELMKQLSGFKHIRNLCAHQQRLWKSTKFSIADVLNELIKFLEIEPYKQINQEFLKDWKIRIEEFKKGNADFINDGYGFSSPTSPILK